jgi:hypothetical protein
VAIEEMSARQLEDVPAVLLSPCRFFTSVSACREIWTDRLDRVAEYLANA